MTAFVAPTGPPPSEHPTGTCEFGDLNWACTTPAALWHFAVGHGWLAVCPAHKFYLRDLDREWDDAEDEEFGR